MEQVKKLKAKISGRLYKDLADGYIDESLNREISRLCRELTDEERAKEWDDYRINAALKRCHFIDLTLYKAVKDFIKAVR